MQAMPALLALPRIDAMPTLTIRDLDDATKTALRVRAAGANRSMEEEARRILREALRGSPEPPQDLAAWMQSRFAKFGGLELPVPAREPARDPPSFAAPARRRKG
jgi:plasmid stability protein